MQKSLNKTISQLKKVESYGRWKSTYTKLVQVSSLCGTRIPVIRENFLNKFIDRKRHIGTPRFPVLGFWLVPGRGVFRGRGCGGCVPRTLPPPPPPPPEMTCGFLIQQVFCKIWRYVYAFSAVHIMLLPKSLRLRIRFYNLFQSPISYAIS